MFSICLVLLSQQSVIYDTQNHVFIMSLLKKQMFAEGRTSRRVVLVLTSTHVIVQQITTHLAI